jgi:hypothetical protein
MNGSPATKRPRDPSPSSQRSSKRHRPATSRLSERGQVESPSFFRTVGHYLGQTGQTVMSWWNRESRTPHGTDAIAGPTTSSSSARKTSPSRRRRNHRSARRLPTNNDNVIDFVDDSDDGDNGASEKAAAEARRRRDKQDAARSTLNDHVRPSSTESSVVDRPPAQPAPPNVHPYLEEHLFKTRFAPVTLSPRAGESSSLTIPAAPHPPRHPDNTDRPLRRYDWAEPESSSSSRSDVSSRPSRSPKYGSPTKFNSKRKSLRSPHDHSQSDRIAQYMRQLEGKDDLAAFQRIQKERQSDRARASPKKKRRSSCG